MPSRELAIQIEQVVRKIGAGYKVNAVFGGRSGTLDKIALKHRPAILIGTPGRVADRIRRNTFSLDDIKTLVLDEFDKSLEVGFEKEMAEIIEALPNVDQRILTSATHEVKIPPFVGLKKAVYINYLKDDNSQLKIKVLLSPDKDKLESLEKVISSMGKQPGIIFCNFKDALQRVSDYLNSKNIEHGCFHGDMEQIDRERTLVKFRNGTLQLLVATDLAARGLDIPEIKFILHYHLPNRNKEFIHRNGRTARMKQDGIAYILHWKGEELPEFVQDIQTESMDVNDLIGVEETSDPAWKTFYITGGRQDKISKADIAGLFLKKGMLNKDQLGVIELHQNCSYVAIHASIAEQVVQQINNSKLKRKKIRVSAI